MASPNAKIWVINVINMRVPFDRPLVQNREIDPSDGSSDQAERRKHTGCY